MCLFDKEKPELAHLGRFCFTERDAADGVIVYDGSPKLTSITSHKGLCNVRLFPFSLQSAIRAFSIAGTPHML